MIYMIHILNPIPIPIANLIFLGGAVIPSRKGSYGSSGQSDPNGVSVSVPDSNGRAAADAALGSHSKVITAVYNNACA